MSVPPSDKFAAGPQGIGYIYQGRYALLQLLKLPEDNALFLEKDDDVEIVEKNGNRSLESLKHKAEGDRVSDLSMDFWKSVRIWLTRYEANGRRSAKIRFNLFTTSTVSNASFVRRLLPDASRDENALLLEIAAALARTESKEIKEVGKLYGVLTEEEQRDFLSRITVVDQTPRINDIPTSPRFQ